MKILVPRIIDAENLNAQNLNAKALLSRASSPEIDWITAHYYSPSRSVVENQKVNIVKLWRRQLWKWHMLLIYQRSVDAIFYPGVEWFDYFGIKVRKITGRSLPVIATLEGLIGDEDREKQLSEIAGHKVYCQRTGAQKLKWSNYILENADHIITISPFLGKIATKLYGNKCSFLPLGIDTNIFYAKDRKVNKKLTVVSAGNVQSHKRPEVFIELASQFTQAEFIWYGDGGEKSELIKTAQNKQLHNLHFPGKLLTVDLAQKFREADIFILPSFAEGVPKVTQEAAACGLPVILFGYYESPTVVDGENGYVVWSDQELYTRLQELLTNEPKRLKMGAAGVEMAKQWDWSNISNEWQKTILKITIKDPC